LIGLRGRFPVLGRDDGQAHLTLLVDVRVVNACLESDLWWLERVLGRERDLDAERALVVRDIVLKQNTETQLHISTYPKEKTHLRTLNCPKYRTKFED
jgi:hypothetical protein